MVWKVVVDTDNYYLRNGRVQGWNGMVEWNGKVEWNGGFHLAETPEDVITSCDLPAISCDLL